MIRPSYTPHTGLISITNRTSKVPWLAFITIGCIMYFFLVVAILHVLRPDDNPIRQAISNYAVGPYGLLMISAFLALARARVAMLLLYVASFGLVIVGIFPGDVNVPHPPATVTGLIHWMAAGTSFLSIMIAAFLLSYCFKEDEHWQSYHYSALVMALITVAALAVFGMLVLIGWIGIGERIYITTSLLWPLFTAVRLWSHATRKGIKR